MILLPTLNRLTKLRNFLDSAITAETSLPGRILIDEKDWDLNKDLYAQLVLPGGWEFKVTEAVTMADKIREYMKEHPPADWVMVVNDDHEIVTKHWDTALVSKLDGKNFVSANDRSLRTFQLPVTATAWSMPLLNTLGWPIYPPGFQHLFIDNIWCEIGRNTGCWRIIASCVVLHKHVLFGQGEKDETHNTVYGADFPIKKSAMWNHDEALYKSFLENDLKDVIAKVKAFQDFLPGEQYRPPV